MHGFLTNEDGVIAVIFALISIPFIALGGWGVDYLRLYQVKDFLQVQADAAALNAMVETADPDEWQAVLEAEIARQYGDGNWATDLAVDGGWLSATDFQVTVSVDVPLAFMSIVPGIPSTQQVSAQAVARLVEPEYIYEPPEIADLDPEAGDFNRVWLYCYWPNRPEGVIDAPVRTQMVPIADNGGSEFEFELDTPPEDQPLSNEYRRVMDDYEHGLDGREEGIWRVRQGGGSHTRTYIYMMPRCPSGSFMSYRLENVRFERTNHARWNRGGERYNYYTDTEIAPGQPEIYHDLTQPSTGRPVAILETVLCEDMEECTSAGGGVIPSGKNRTPQRASQACSSGNYMYYGWEDRPPGQTGPARDWRDFAWTDADYDDIRIIIKCPIAVRSGDRVARLVG